MASLVLRDYQEKALKTVQKELGNGIFRQLIVLPTGSGKTIIVATIGKALQ